MVKFEIIDFKMTNFVKISVARLCRHAVRKRFAFPGFGPKDIEAMPHPNSGGAAARNRKMILAERRSLSALHGGKAARITETVLEGLRLVGFGLLQGGS